MHFRILETISSCIDNNNYINRDKTQSVYDESIFKFSLHKFQLFKKIHVEWKRGRSIDRGSDYGIWTHVIYRFPQPNPKFKQLDPHARNPKTTPQIEMGKIKNNNWKTHAPSPSHDHTLAFITQRFSNFH